MSVERIIRAAGSVRQVCEKGTPGGDSSLPPLTPPRTPGTPAATPGPVSVSSCTTLEITPGRFPSVSSHWLSSTREGGLESEDHLDAIRREKQRNVLCMERLLLEQWFFNMVTIPLPIKV